MMAGPEKKIVFYANSLQCKALSHETRAFFSLHVIRNAIKFKTNTILARPDVNDYNILCVLFFY